MGAHESLKHFKLKKWEQTTNHQVCKLKQDIKQLLWGTEVLEYQDIVHLLYLFIFYWKNNNNVSRIDEYGMKHQQCETGHTGRTQNRVKLFQKGQMGTLATSGSVYFLGNIIITLQRTMCIRQVTTLCYNIIRIKTTYWYSVLDETIHNTTTTE